MAGPAKGPAKKGLVKLSKSLLGLFLVGDDWNHEILNDFPFSWEFHHPN